MAVQQPFFLILRSALLFHKNREVTRKTQRDSILKVSSLNEIIKFHNKFRPLGTAFFSQSRNIDMLGDWLLYFNRKKSRELNSFDSLCQFLGVEGGAR